MSTSRVMSALALVVIVSIPALAETGDLKIRFEYGGSPLDPAALDVNKDVEFCGKHGLKSETLLINKENKGIQNVLVYVYTGRGGSDIEEVAPAKKTHTLANQNCRFEPHIVIAQAGDTLKVTNPDPVGHNANLNFIMNKADNFTVPAKQEKSVELVEPEPAPIPVDCNIHPWMRAYIVVLEHPYVALSDKNGEMVLKGLPAGEELAFRVWVQAADGALGDLETADGDELELDRRNVFEVEINPGMNDLGTVVIPADALKAD